MTILGYGDFRYERDSSWPKASKYQSFGFPSSAAVNDEGHIFVIGRRTEQPITIWDKDGSFLHAWGAGEFSNEPHGITIAPNGNVWVVDRDYHVASEFTQDGKKLRSLGEKLRPSPTWHGRFIKSVPFNMPTNLAFAPNGDIFVSDGYGNHRVHRFSPDGELLLSWGVQGTGPGQFALVHNVWVDKAGRVLVNDDENHRVQVFTMDGEYITEWPMLNPSGAYLRDDIFYVANLGPYEDPSKGPGWGAITIWDLEGNKLSEFVGTDGDDRRALVGPHDLGVDQEGSLYVCEGPIGRVAKFRRV